MMVIQTHNSFIMHALLNRFGSASSNITHKCGGGVLSFRHVGNLTNLAFLVSSTHKELLALR